MAIDINIPSQVKTYANLAGFPATGSLKTIFIAEDTNKTYRWTGSAYVEISASQATAWGAITGTLSNQTDLQTALNAKVTGNTAIIGATKTKITYDSKGLVTSGADATTADIADSINKRYVTDANLTVIGNTSGVNTGDQTLTGLGGVPTSRTLTINGTTQDLSADRTFTISTGITIGTTAITSGTVGRVLFQGTGNVVSQSANLFFDVTNSFLGLGGTPARRLDVISDGTNWISGVFAGSGGTPKLVVGNLSGLATIGGHNATLTAWAALAINSGGGNVLIGTTTDAGFKLDVNGTARVQNDLTVRNNYVFSTSFSNSRLGITTAGVTGDSFVDLFPKLVTGGSDVGFTVWSKGSPTSITNYELLEFRYDNTNRRYCLDSIAGGTGTVLPFHFYTGTNTNQLKIQINGNISINSSSDLASAQLQVDSTTKGFLPPRMTTTQKNAIASPATGLMVYDTTLNLISVYNGTTWITL